MSKAVENEIRLDFSYDKLVINANANLLTQAIKNLVDNAINTLQKTQECLTSFKVDNQHCFIVKDEGPVELTRKSILINYFNVFTVLIQLGRDRWEVQD